jgi:hypothetical protein
MVNCYGVYVSQMTMVIFRLSQSQARYFLIHVYHGVNNMKGVTSATENACPSGAHVFTPNEVHVLQFLEFWVFF